MNSQQEKPTFSPPFELVSERLGPLPLVNHFMDRLNNKHGQAAKTISKSAMDMLCDYDWPGNVRELENVLERSVILEEKTVLEVASFPEKMLRRPDRGGQSFFEGAPRATLEDLEREYLLKVLDSTGWQKKKASNILGINASTLYRKIQRYELEKNQQHVLVD